jgi:hypothetical protein
MYWEQGEAQLESLIQNSTSRYREDYRCVLSWRKLNPTWTVRVLDRKQAEAIAPLYAKQASKEKVTPALRSDLLRLDLLTRYGGVWADVSACPTVPLDTWLFEEVRPTGFFTFWTYHQYDDKVDSKCDKDLSRREVAPNGDKVLVLGGQASRSTVTWFMAATKPRHEVLQAWLDKFYPRVDAIGPSTKKFTYYLAHCTLTQLIGENSTVRDSLHKMPHRDASHIDGF